jgi:hypothetical protein
LPKQHETIEANEKMAVVERTLPRLLLEVDQELALLGVLCHASTDYIAEVSR